MRDVLRIFTDFVTYYTNWSNFFISLGVALASLVVLRYLPGERKTPAREMAEVIVAWWCAYWFLGSLLYLLLIVDWLGVTVTLFLNDTQHVILLGLAATIYRGEDFSLKDFAFIGGPLMFLMLLVDIGGGNFAFQVDDPIQELKWILLVVSIALLLVAFLATALVFLFRFGWPAAWFSVAIVIYGALHLPIYSSYLLENEFDTLWLSFLALWKIVIASLFFVFMLASRPSWSSLDIIPIVKYPGFKSRRVLKILLWILGSIVTGVMSSLIAALLLD